MEDKVCKQSIAPLVFQDRTDKWKATCCLSCGEVVGYHCEEDLSVGFIKYNNSCANFIINLIKRYVNTKQVDNFIVASYFWPEGTCRAFSSQVGFLTE